MEGVAQLLGRRRPAGGGADRAALPDQRLAGVGGDVDRVAVGGVDHRAEQLAAAARVGGDDGRAGVRGERPLQRRLGGGGVVEGEDEDRRLLADPERLQAPAQLGGLEAPAERAGEHVAGQPPLGLTRDAAAHQLQRDHGDRLLEDQPLEVAEAAGVADDHHPGLGRAAAGRDHRVGERPAGDGGVGGDEGVPVAGVGERFFADRLRPRRRRARGESRGRRAARRGCREWRRCRPRRRRSCRDLLQAALLQDQPLEPPLHGDPPLQNLVLLVDQAGEGFLGDRDERGRVGNLEEREVALLAPRRARPWAVFSWLNPVPKPRPARLCSASLRM